MHEIEGAFDGLMPRVAPWLYCGVGITAASAASLLERLGIDAVVVDDSVEMAALRGVQWCDGDNCTDLMCTAAIATPEAAAAQRV